MIGLSTVWTMKRGASTPQEVLDPILDLGFEAIELEFRITGKLLEGMAPSLKAGAPRVISVHNFCPVPDILPPQKAGGDAFNIASLDREERERAVRYTCRTLEVAHGLEVGAVVLHLGYIEGEERKDAPQRAYREGRWGKEELQEYLKERSLKAPPHLDAVFFSLERVLRRAETLGVKVGVENRYHLSEIPLGEEIGMVLEEFAGGPIGYWHDTGHAAVAEALGAIRQKELLERYGARMIGIHLHDAQGVDDHLPPGRGGVDFEMVGEFLREGVLKVMEIHPPATGEEIVEGLQFLREKGIS
ncbi:MAG: hypothetical protein DRG36_06980 [Deltaproteobacteria bacterium]|nr:MAG: hypothetical protein DRG36_06980 [Deltaproteobacteria bacterium]